MKSEAVGDAVARVLTRLQERRERLGLAGIPEAEAELRARALMQLTGDQFDRLLAVEPAEARENEIRALIAAQRRDHTLWRLAVVAISSLDSRPLLRWWCTCGAEAEGDYLTAPGALAAWAAHAGLDPEIPRRPPEPLEERECPGCGVRFAPEFPRQQYHSAACRKRAWRRDRPVLGSEGDD